MLVARTLPIVFFGALAALAGCALPHKHQGRQNASAAQDRGKTLIRVDQEGNVYRGDDAPPQAEPAADDAAASSRSARRAAAIQADGSAAATSAARGNFGELAAAIDAPKVDAARVAELVAAHQPAPPRHVDAPAQVEIGDATASTATAEPASAAIASPTEVSPAAKTTPLPAGVFPTVVRTTRFELEYDDQVLGEGGIAKVELYGTRDAGRTWERLGEDADRRSPYTVEMPNEGVYGFRIAVAGKNGLASRPPKSGELPELWVRVDLSQPMFRANLRPAGDAIAAVDVQSSDASPSDQIVADTADTSPMAKIEQSQVSQASHVEVIVPQAPPTDWKSHLAEAIAATEAALQETTATGAGQSLLLTDDEKSRLSAHLRMLYVAAGRHEEAIRSSAHQDTHQNEFWSHQMHGLKLLVEPTQSPAARQASAALAELREAADKLAAMSELQVKSLAFCTAANSFGVYETTIDGTQWKHNDYSQRKFAPEQPVVLYFEVANFASEQTTSREYPDGAWRTSLRGSYTIVDASGSPVEQRELKLKDDVCRNRRHDYYVAYKSWIPKLNPGHYSLELLVEDTIAGKIGTSSIDFEVVAK